MVNNNKSAQEKRATALEHALNDAMSYNDYMTLMESLVQRKSTTGANQKEDLIEYTKLNYQRMKRLNKTLKIEEKDQDFFKDKLKNVHWLVLTESWCGDAAQTIPMLHKIANLGKGIQFQIALRDAHPALMDFFLTNGGQAIPKLIAYDPKTKAVLYDWGPRPKVATEMVQKYKSEKGTVDAEFKKSLQLWYTKDKGQSTVNDFRCFCEDSKSY